MYILTQVGWVRYAASQMILIWRVQSYFLKEETEINEETEIVSGGRVGMVALAHLFGNLAEAQLWVPAWNSNFSSHLQAMET